MTARFKDILRNLKKKTTKKTTFTGRILKGLCVSCENTLKLENWVNQTFKKVASNYEPFSAWCLLNGHT